MKYKLAKDTEIHKTDNIRTMQVSYQVDSQLTINNLIIFVCDFFLKENVTLIKEVNDLRKELKTSRSRIHDLETALGISRKNAATTTDAIVTALHMHQGNHLVEEKQTELQRIIEHQKSEIKRLREKMDDLELRLNSRPPSSSQLPPLSVN